MDCLLGRYELGEKIGEGGMATVFGAHDPDIDRPLAVKFLREEMCADTTVVARFLSEARAAGVLSHRGIVTIYDVGESDGRPYIVMERLHGCALDQWLEENGTMSPGRVVDIGMQIAAALEYAHQRGVVHRDIKPSNIWICDDGTVKILDFGIARRSEEDRLRAEAEALRTYAGQVVGTPRYMSPEQALGHTLDFRTDYFSLGLVLYEMLCGKPAFDGDSLATVALRITQDDYEPVERCVSDCPKGLAYIIRRLTQKAPDRRFASGTELVAAFRREQNVQDDRRFSWLGFGGRQSLFGAAAALTATVLLVAYGFVLNHQEKTAHDLFATAGGSIANFLAENAAVSVVENAGRAADEQDWLALQEFVRAASEDANIKAIRVVDASATIVAASDVAFNGSQADSLSMEVWAGESPAFEEDIAYAGLSFGKVQIALDSQNVDRAVRHNSFAFAGLFALIFFVVMGAVGTIAHFLLKPMDTARKAVADLAAGTYDYRLPENQDRLIGELYSGLNQIATRIEDAEIAQSAPKPAEEDTLSHTIICPSIAQGDRV